MIEAHNNKPYIVKSLFSWGVSNMPTVLLLLTLILFISNSLYNVPMAIMAVLGAWQMIKNPSAIYADRLTCSYVIVFLCLWIPMLLGFIDAVDTQHSFQTVFPYLRFLFAGIYVLQSKERSRILTIVITASFLITSLWSIDASIQYLFGRNLLGYPYQAGQITGMFYPKNTIAHLLAALSPIYFETLRRYSKRRIWLWALAVPLVVVILLSGRRAAWIMLILSIGGYTYYLYKMKETGLKTKKILLLTGVAIIISSALVIATNKPLQRRIAVTAGIFSLDYETVDRATAWRLPIWETAIAVFQDNWINGIGPRGFRHVYTKYSREDDIWHESGTTHPHQLVLEVLAETGIIGFVGILCFVFLLYRLFKNLSAFGFVFPCALAIFVVLFPVNTSMAFYGSYWSTVIWWLVILSYLAVDDAHEQKQQAKSISPAISIA